MQGSAMVTLKAAFIKGNTKAKVRVWARVQISTYWGWVEVQVSVRLKYGQVQDPVRIICRF
jgi:hypothetical protein